MTAPTSDRERWNARYRNEEPAGTPLLLGRNLHLFPRTGRAIDVAGGDGQAGAILAARGMDVTVADVSDVALGLAEERAARNRIPLTTLQIDLVSEPFPAGPWDVITCFNYLDRALFPVFAEQLADGLLVVLGVRLVEEGDGLEEPAEAALDDLGDCLVGLALVAGLGLDPLLRRIDHLIAVVIAYLVGVELLGGLQWVVVELVRGHAPMLPDTGAAKPRGLH